MTTGLEARHRYFILAAICVALIMHSRIYINPYLEWDEIVYLFLSEKMSWAFNNYSTQGSFIDAKLPGNVYSAEIFHHPPLIPYLIKVFSIPMPSILAARTLNLAFIAASIYFLFRLTLSLSGFTGAMLATVFWVFCPIFNLESNRVHLDFPATVLILAGAWYFHQFLERGSLRHVLFSGGAFALAMLTKFTAPVFILLPLFLTLASKSFFRERTIPLFYFGLVALGFSWWVVVLMKYGSLLPVEFVGKGTEETFHSSYLDSIRARSWYHIWIYFLAFFPLALIYMVDLGKNLSMATRRRDTFYKLPPSTRFILLLNLASILAVVVFDIANAFSNKAWAFRHIMPIFPFIYIATAHAVSSCLTHKNLILRNATALLTGLTLILMASSTYYTVRDPLNLKVIPSIFEWISGLKPFFI